MTSGESKITDRAASCSSEEGELHMVEEDPVSGEESNQGLNNNNQMEQDDEEQNNADLKEKLIKMSLGRMPPLLPLGLPPAGEAKSDPRE